MNKQQAIKAVNAAQQFIPPVLFNSIVGTDAVKMMLGIGNAWDLFDAPRNQLENTDLALAQRA